MGLYFFAITDTSIETGTNYMNTIQQTSNTITGTIPYSSGNPLIDALAEFAWIFVRVGAFFVLMVSLTGWLSSVTGSYGMFFTVFNVILVGTLAYLAIRLLRGSG